MARRGLERFVHAQAGNASRGDSYAVALREMRTGQKLSCWVWYVFPQYKDRKGSMNTTFQIRNREEALLYLQHPLLGRRYVEIATAVRDSLATRSAEELMSYDVDAKKLHQSVSLFWLAAKELQMQRPAGSGRGRGRTHSSRSHFLLPSFLPSCHLTRIADNSSPGPDGCTVDES